MPALRLAVLAAVLLNVPPAVGQDAPPANEVNDIVKRMMPNGVPTVLIFPEDEQQKEQYVQLLKEEQTSGTGKRAQQVAYLLIKLGSDEQANRRFLLQALQGCLPASSAADCDEDTAAFAISLHGEGAKEFLSPLIQIGLTSDGALSEILGDFYAALLLKNPSSFLGAIRTLPATQQTHVCNMAGSRDGGGMSLKELTGLRLQLQAIGTSSSRRCLRAVEGANEAIGASVEEGQCSTPHESVSWTIGDDGVIGLPLHGWVGYTNTGTPVENMLVECFKDRYKSLVATALTDDHGRFSFPSLGEGTYYLKATAANVFPIHTAVRVSSKSKAQVCLIAEAQ